MRHFYAMALAGLVCILDVAPACALAPSSKVSEAAQTLTQRHALEQLKTLFLKQIDEVYSLTSSERSRLNARAEDYASAIAHADPRMRAPLVLDIYLFAAKDPVSQEKDLDVMVDAAKQGGTLILAGNFSMAWWFYGLIQEKYPALAGRVYAMEDLTADIPKGLATLDTTPEVMRPLIPMRRWDKLADYVDIRLTPFPGSSKKEGFQGLEVFLGGLLIGNSQTYGVDVHGNTISLGGFSMMPDYRDYGLSEIVLRKIRARYPKKKMAVPALVAGSEKFLIQMIDKKLIDEGPRGINAQGFRDQLSDSLTNNAPRKKTAEATLLVDGKGKIKRLSGSLVDAIRQIMESAA